MPPYDRLALFGGSAHPDLTRAVAEAARRPQGHITVGRFKDGEIHVELQDDVRGADVFLIQPTSPPVNEHLMELLVMIDASRRASAGRITAVMPYFGYARQEKKTTGREAISAKLVANLLTTAGADRVVMMDLSAPAIEGFFDIPVDHLSAVPLLARHLAGLELVSPVIVAPDVGAVRRTDRLRRRMGDLPLAILFKDRPRPDVATISSMVGDVEGCCAILLDDLISTGGTLVAAANLLVERGAARVLAVATHGVFSSDAMRVLNDSPLERVIVTDTIPAAADPLLEVVTVAPLLGEVITRIHFGISVRDLIRSL